MITLEAKMKISYSLAILNITNSFLLTNMPALYLIALTQMLIVFSNICCSAYKLLQLLCCDCTCPNKYQRGGYRLRTEMISFHPCTHTYRSETVC